MAFCSNCGAEIAEGTKFCPSCGTAVNGQAVSVAADTNLQVSERESSLNELSKMLEYFSKKKDLYERLKINQIYTKIEWGHGKKPKKIATKWILFAAIPYILCLFCIASLIILIIAILRQVLISTSQNSLLNSRSAATRWLSFLISLWAL